MNLRTLKKKSKLAAPLLRHFKIGKKEFLAERGENYHGLNIRCPHKPKRLSGCRQGCAWHPLKGTPMVGAMSGYYEPEWYERTAFEELCDLILWGDRPETMSDAEWKAALCITGVTPLTIEDIREMWGDSHGFWNSK